MSSFICKYELGKPFSSWRHVWTVVGARIAVHLHIGETGAGEGDKYYGGIEIHYRSPPSYMKDDATPHLTCWLLGGPCWHDGSSLQADEIWIPRWRRDPHDHEGMFQGLKQELRERDGEYETEETSDE